MAMFVEAAASGGLLWLAYIVATQSAQAPVLAQVVAPAGQAL
jgi:hypothetical protein